MICRSAITGRFVSHKFGRRNPKTTVWETAGNTHKRKLPKGHRLIKRYAPIIRNPKGRA